MKKQATEERPGRAVLDLALPFVPVVLLAFLVLIYVTVLGAGSDAGREASARAEASAENSARAEQILKDLEAEQRRGNQTVRDSIADIVDALRLSVDCVYLRGQGLRPAGCAEVNERVNALARGEGFPTPPPRIPSAPRPTTSTPAPLPAPAPAPPPPSPPVTQPAPLPEGTPPPIAAPARQKCTIELLGLCI